VAVVVTDFLEDFVAEVASLAALLLEFGELAESEGGLR
jgi:hypothetical protein